MSTGLATAQWYPFVRESDGAAGVIECVEGGYMGPDGAEPPRYDVVCNVRDFGVTPLGVKVTTLLAASPELYRACKKALNLLEFIQQEGYEYVGCDQLEEVEYALYMALKATKPDQHHKLLGEKSWPVPGDMSSTKTGGQQCRNDG